MNCTYAIEVENLTKYYGNFLAVDNISFNVEKGEFFGLLGPNGAGKTTTIRMITGLLRPTRGMIRVMGIDVIKRPVEVKTKIGVVSEGVNPYPRLSAWDNLMFAGSLHDIPRRELEERAENLLKLLGIYERSNEKVENLSKGMKKRLLIAMAVIHDPPLLFLDEPTAGLDVQSSRLIRTFLRKLNERGTTIFLTTHYIEEADVLCDRVGIIKDGKIIALDSPENLKASNKKGRLIEISFNGHTTGIEKEIAKLQGVSKVLKKGDKFQLYTHDISSIVREVSEFAKVRGLKIVSINTPRPTLEDAFVRLTGLSSLDLERMEQIGKLRRRRRMKE